MNRFNRRLRTRTPGRQSPTAPTASTFSTRFDVVVIGAGVVGTAIAAELAQTEATVCVLEASDDVADGASKGNAGITSAYYSPNGTLGCDLLEESNDRWEDICGRLGVPYRRIGALTAALDESEMPDLDVLEQQVRATSARVERLTGEQARALEPMLSPECIAALHYPDEGIIDPTRLTWAYAELAARNGASFVMEAPAVGFDRDDAGSLTAVRTPIGTVSGRFFVNAAGLQSGAVSVLAGGENISMWPRRGQYYILDRDFGEQMTKIVLPVPGPNSRGIEVAPTTNGSVILGPDAIEGGAADDTESDPEGLRRVAELAGRLIPSASLERAIKSYAGNRPVADEAIRIRMDHIVPNLLQAGNRSIGVSCSPAMATRAVELLADRGAPVARRPGAVDRLPPVKRLRDQLDPTQDTERIDGDELVVCLCEHVTAAEIDAALTCAVPARSVEGVRKRTRATGGRCQGSVCMAGVVLMCGTAHDVEVSDVRVGGAGGVIGRA